MRRGERRGGGELVLHSTALRALGGKCLPVNQPGMCVVLKKILTIRMFLRITKIIQNPAQKLHSYIWWAYWPVHIFYIIFLKYQLTKNHPKLSFLCDATAIQTKQTLTLHLALLLWDWFTSWGSKLGSYEEKQCPMSFDISKQSDTPFLLGTYYVTSTFS